MNRTSSSMSWQKEGLLLEVERTIAEARELLSVQQAKQAGERLVKAASLLRRLAHVTNDVQLRESRLTQADILEARASACRGEAATREKTTHQPPRKDPKPVPAQEDSEGQFQPYRGRKSVTFDDVAGLEELKEEIRLRMIEPFRFPDLALRAGLDSGGNLLLYGPPGTGKTLIARAVAGEIDAAFYSIKSSDLMSKWVGDAEKNVSQLFQELYSNERAVLFLDEIEALMPKRQGNASTVMARVVPEFLAQLDGFDQNDDRCAMVIGATNEPWSLDRAVLRPGRFDVQVHVGLPDQSARRHLLELALSRTPTEVQCEDYSSLVEVSEGMSGADFRGFARELGKHAFPEMKIRREYRVPLDVVHKLLKFMPRSVSKKDERRYFAYKRNIETGRN